MEMLNGMNALQCAPVPEPDDILLSTDIRERLVDEMVDLCPSLLCQIAIGISRRYGTGRKLKFGPGNKVDNSPIDPIWPVVVQNLIVVLSSRQ
jgi:hypothetical protein